MKFLIALILAGSFGLSLARASTSGQLRVVGYVTSFDQQKITVESGSQKFEIPRKMYSEKAQLGELISVAMTPQDFSSLKRVNPVAKH